MPQSNYEKAFERMPSEFLKYDQQRMIQNFHLAHDGAYLYLTMLARHYRVSRHEGTAEWTENGADYAPAGILDSMVLYDLLCCAKDGCRLAVRKICPARRMAPIPPRACSPLSPRAVTARRRRLRRRAADSAASICR